MELIYTAGGIGLFHSIRMSIFRELLRMDAFSFSIGFLIGALVVAVTFAIVIRLMLNQKKREQKLRGGGVRKIATPILALMLVALFLFSQPGVSLPFSQVIIVHAQTETLVPLNIPINPILNQTNTWMNTFAPISAIGIGISLAIAILGYISLMIRSAFR